MGTMTVNAVPRELQQRMEPDTRPLVEPVVQNNAGARKKLAALSSVSNT
jgi:hypothetical protein